MLLLSLLLADKASVSYRSEEEEETDEEGQEKEMEEDEQKEEMEESGAGTTRKTVPGTGAVCRTGLAIGFCLELH